MSKLLLRALSVGAGIILAGNAQVRGDTLYQNTILPTGQVMNFPNNQQIGEQIWLGPTVPEYLTNFSFEYYSPLSSSSYSGTVQMDVRLYANDSATLFNGYATPGTLFFDSGNFTLENPWSVSLTNSATVIFQLSDLLTGNTVNLNPTFVLPTNFTFSVTVSGLSGSDAVALPIFPSGQVQVGWNAGDYWYDVSGNWELLTNNAGPIAFGTQFFGQTTPTPEPSVLCLGAIGAAALTIIARRRQRRG